MDDKAIPDDVKNKLLAFAKAGLAVALMKGRSYLSIGGVSMGIAGSTVEPDFFQSYLGMRNEFVDSTEVFRRMETGIYDKDESKMALKWTKENWKEGKNNNEAEKQRSQKKKREKERRVGRE